MCATLGTGTWEPPLRLGTSNEMAALGLGARRAAGGSRP